MGEENDTNTAGEEVAGAPVTWLVAERRGGRWLFGDDWCRECDSRAEAELVAEKWTDYPPEGGVGVFAVVQVAGPGDGGERP